MNRYIFCIHSQIFVRAIQFHFLFIHLFFSAIYLTLLSQLPGKPTLQKLNTIILNNNNLLFPSMTSNKSRLLIMTCIDND